MWKTTAAAMLLATTAALNAAGQDAAHVIDDASKAMLFDPDNLANDARKIRAYDENKAVLRKITTLSKSASTNVSTPSTALPALPAEFRKVT